MTVDHKNFKAIDGLVVSLLFLSLLQIKAILAQINGLKASLLLLILLQDNVEPKLGPKAKGTSDLSNIYLL